MVVTTDGTHGRSVVTYFLVGTDTEGRHSTILLRQVQGRRTFRSIQIDITRCELKKKKELGRQMERNWDLLQLCPKELGDTGETRDRYAYRKKMTSILLILPLWLWLLSQENFSLATFFSLNIQNVSIYMREGINQTYTCIEHVRLVEAREEAVHHWGHMYLYLCFHYL
jgi:hypothetical protein